MQPDYQKIAKVLLIALIAFAALIMLKTAVFAADKGGPSQKAADLVVPAKSWSGCYVAVHGGIAAMDTKAGLSHPTPGTIIELDGISATGALYGAGTGCDVQMGKIVIGAFGDYDKFNQAEWNLNILPASVGVNFSTALDHQWAIGGRVGYLFTPSTLFYGLAAYSQLEMSAFSGSIGGTPIGSLSMPTFKGWQVGGGVEQRLQDGWFVKGEYRYGLYDQQSVPIGGGLALDVDPSVHTARIAIGYRFGASVPTLAP